VAGEPQNLLGGPVGLCDDGDERLRDGRKNSTAGSGSAGSSSKKPRTDEDGAYKQ